MICARLSVIVLLTGLAACASKYAADHYYSLVLAADSVAAAVNTERADAHMIVGPIQLPDYLNKRGLALQMGPSQIQVASHHFWAEPLDEAIAKVLVRDISMLVDNVAVDRDTGRWSIEGDCRLRVEFDSFHATSESRVVGSGRYWITSSASSTRQEFAVSRTLFADGYSHAVEALRELLGTLAEQISDTIDYQAQCNGGQAAQRHLSDTDEEIIR